MIRGKGKGDISLERSFDTICGINHRKTALKIRKIGMKKELMASVGKRRGSNSDVGGDGYNKTLWLSPTSVLSLSVTMPAYSANLRVTQLIM